MYFGTPTSAGCECVLAKGTADVSPWCGFCFFPILHVRQLSKSLLKSVIGRLAADCAWYLTLGDLSAWRTLTGWREQVVETRDSRQPGAPAHKLAPRLMIRSRSRPFRLMTGAFPRIGTYSEQPPLPPSPLALKLWPLVEPRTGEKTGQNVPASTE